MIVLNIWHKGCGRGRHGTRKRIFAAALGLLARAMLCVFAGSALAGCSTLGNYLNLRNSFLNPSEVGRFDLAHPYGRVKLVTWPILDSLAVNDPPPHPWRDSVLPTAADLVASRKPYVLGPGDVLTISVFQLVVPGQESVQTREINTDGTIVLDFIGTIHVQGLTVAELRAKIVRRLISGGLMSPPGPHEPGPQVNVALTQARRRVFSILGAVNHAGTYNIMTPDFRLLDALALAGDIPMQPGMRWLYVIRGESSAAHTPRAAARKPVPPRPTASTPAKILENIAHELAAPATAPRRRAGPAATAPTAPGPAPAATASPPADSATLPTRPAATRAPFYNFAHAAPVPKPGDLVIRIPLQKLRQGDPRYNIVIRSGDIINVPPVQPAYYYVMGNVNRPGVYSMTGQRITLKMAVAAAGNLGPLAIPRRCELIRRIGRNQESIIQVNLQAIFDGREPDIFLKPNDVLNVGTDLFAYPLAVIRNGFQAAYGFGFTYDRNYYIQPTIVQP